MWLFLYPFLPYWNVIRPFSILLIIVLAAAVLVSGCTTPGGHPVTATTAAPTPSSYVIVETETETPSPVPTTAVVNATPVVTAEPTLPPKEMLETGKIRQSFPYVIRTRSQVLSYTSYGGVRDYLARAFPDRTLSAASLSSGGEIYTQFTGDPVQKTYLAGFIDNIADRSDLPAERVRIFISLIQHIPTRTSAGTLLPYDVLHANQGTPAEKSILAAYVLSQMGYGTALLVYPSERHVALGLKCPKQYSVAGSGYCFVETAYPTIMTYRNGTYNGIGRLTSNPLIIKTSDGGTFDQASEEYTDAASYERALNSAVVNGSGMYMDSINSDIFGDLREKYGLFDLDVTRIS